MRAVSGITPVAGLAGRSLYFDGTSNFVTVPLQCSNPLLTTYPCKPLSGFSSITIALWVYASAKANMTLVDRGGVAGSQQEYQMMLLMDPGAPANPTPPAGWVQ